jgi:hypothetical protein
MLQVEKKLLMISQQKVILEIFQNKILKIMEKLKVII